MSGLTLPQFFDPAAVAALRQRVRDVAAGLVLVVGCGATLVCDADVLVYADLARWEAQNRFRRNESSNLGVANAALSAALQYKRAYFVDWRVCDRWKRPLITKWDFVLDTNDPGKPKLAEGEAVRRGLRHAVTRPFRVVPFFDPAPWGGQWMKEVCGLETGTSLIREQHPSGRPGESVTSPFPANYGWCFDCVPEENSLLLGFGGLRLEIPVTGPGFRPAARLAGREGACPLRRRVPHPLRFPGHDGRRQLVVPGASAHRYIQQHFGMSYTQDESYYLLDAAATACVYLGLREGIDPDRMVRDLKAAAERWTAL